MRKLVLFLFLILAETLPAQVKIVFRYDDYAADPPGSRASDSVRQAIWEAEQGLDQLFAVHQKKYVVGVIPDHDAPLDADPEKLDLLKRSLAAGRIELALHGYKHVNHSPGAMRGEFLGRSYEQQKRDIENALAVMDRCGLKPTTFVPPWNGWDANTAAILEGKKFQIISGERAWLPRNSVAIKIIPYNSTLTELEEAVTRGINEPGIVVALFHTVDMVAHPEIRRRSQYDARVPYFGLKRLERLIEKIEEKKYAITTLQELHEQAPAEYTWEQARLNYNYVLQQRFWRRMLPAEEIYPRVYYSEPKAAEKILHNRILVSAFTLGWLAAGGLLLVICRKLFAQRFYLFQLFFTLLFLLGCARILYLMLAGYSVNGINCIPLLISFAFIADLLIAVVVRYRRKDGPVVVPPAPQVKTPSATVAK